MLGRRCTGRMSDARVTEAEIVQTVRRRAAPGPREGVAVGIGDDCAVLQPEPGRRLLATTDLLVEDVHFRRRYAAPSDIGWKALAVNLSDIASMGGRPRWALVALACPEATEADDIRGFYTAALGLADEHGVTIVGGDTSMSTAGWVVNVSLLGTSRRPLLRSTARVGDVVLVTGALGRSRAGLALLDHADSLPVDATARADAVGAHLRPRPRVREGQWLAGPGSVTAMIDLSDGLATDLGHVARASGVGARVHLERVPVAASARAIAAALGEDARSWATSGGEDYELLLTCAPEAARELGDGLRRATGTVLSEVGEIIRGEGVQFIDEHGTAVAVASGFEHFVTGRHRD